MLHGRPTKFSLSRENVSGILGVVACRFERGQVESPGLAIHRWLVLDRTRHNSPSRFLESKAKQVERIQNVRGK